MSASDCCLFLKVPVTFILNPTAEEEKEKALLNYD